MSSVRKSRYPELFRKKGSSRWWARIPNPNGGKHLRESTGHRDERAAHRWFLERTQSLGRAVSAEAAEGKQRTVRDTFATWREWMNLARQHNDPSVKKLAQDTIDFYVEKSRAAIYVLGADTLLSEITAERLREYVATRMETAKGRTIAYEMTTLSLAWEMARRDGVECKPFADVRPSFDARYVPKTRWLAQWEVDELVFEDLPARRAAVVAFLVATGATYPSEVVGVRPHDVRQRSGRWEVHLPGTKRASRNRWLPVPSHAQKYIEFAVKHLGAHGFDPWTNIRGDLHEATARLSRCKECRASIRAWARHEHGATRTCDAKDCKACVRIQRDAEAAGKARRVEPCSPNDLRRTFAQWLRRSEVPDDVLYPMLGHTSPRMIRTVYARRDDVSNVSALVERHLQRAPANALGEVPARTQRASRGPAGRKHA